MLGCCANVFSRHGKRRASFHEDLQWKKGERNNNFSRRDSLDFTIGLRPPVFYIDSGDSTDAESQHPIQNGGPAGSLREGFSDSNPKTIVAASNGRLDPNSQLQRKSKLHNEKLPSFSALDRTRRPRIKCSDAILDGGEIKLIHEPLKFETFRSVTRTPPLAVIAPLSCAAGQLQGLQKHSHFHGCDTDDGDDVCPGTLHHIGAGGSAEQHCEYCNKGYEYDHDIPAEKGIRMDVSIHNDFTSSPVEISYDKNDKCDISKTAVGTMGECSHDNRQNCENKLKQIDGSRLSSVQSEKELSKVLSFDSNTSNSSKSKSKVLKMQLSLNHTKSLVYAEGNGKQTTAEENTRDDTGSLADMLSSQHKKSDLHAHDSPKLTLLQRLTAFKVHRQLSKPRSKTKSLANPEISQSKHSTKNVVQPEASAPSHVYNLSSLNVPAGTRSRAAHSASHGESKRTLTHQTSCMGDEDDSVCAYHHGGFVNEGFYSDDLTELPAELSKEDMLQQSHKRDSKYDQTVSSTKLQMCLNKTEEDIVSNPCTHNYCEKQNPLSCSQNEVGLCKTWNTNKICPGAQHRCSGENVSHCVERPSLENHADTKTISSNPFTNKMPSEPKHKGLPTRPNYLQLPEVMSKSSLSSAISASSCGESTYTADSEVDTDNTGKGCYTKSVTYQQALRRFQTRHDLLNADSTASLQDLQPEKVSESDWDFELSSAKSGRKEELGHLAHSPHSTTSVADVSDVSDPENVSYTLKAKTCGSRSVCWSAITKRKKTHPGKKKVSGIAETLPRPNQPNRSLSNQPVANTLEVPTKLTATETLALGDSESKSKVDEGHSKSENLHLQYSPKRVAPKKPKRKNPPSNVSSTASRRAIEECLASDGVTSATSVTAASFHTQVNNPTSAKAAQNEISSETTENVTQFHHLNGVHSTTMNHNLDAESTTRSAMAHLDDVNGDDSKTVTWLFYMPPDLCREQVFADFDSFDELNGSLV